jgi:hypothetical protein
MRNVAGGPLPVNAGADPPVRVIVNTIALPRAFVGAHNSEAVLGLPPRPFRAALRASRLPVTRVRGLGPVVEREAFCAWLASQKRAPSPAPSAPVNEADRALEAAGFVRRAPR